MATDSVSYHPRADKPPERQPEPAKPHVVTPGDPSDSHKPGWRRWLFRLIVVSLAVGGYFAWPHLEPRVAPYLAGLSRPKPAPQQPRPVPVVTSVVRKGDMHIYLNGLGAVTAFYTVTLRSRVDGELVKVLFSEGEMVDKGKVLAEIDPRPFEVQLEQAEGQLNRDEATLKVAELDLKRYTTLRSTGTVTQQDLDAQLGLVAQSKGAVQVDRAQIANAKLQLDYCHIVAPISGRIGLRMVDPGNMVHANDLNGLASITQLQPIAVVFTIPQDEISRVQKKRNEDDELEVEAWDRDFNSKLATGRLLAIDNQVDPATGTLRLKAKFENADNMLFPNQFVNSRLLVDIRRDAVIVPSAAIQRGPETAFVYVVVEDAVELRPVVVGPSEGAETLIETGVATGEIVVTDGIDKLQPGTKIVTRDKDEGGRRKDEGKGRKDEGGVRKEEQKA